jgi:cytosine/adenosine deaminase-related metal-dependent hydrolase
VFDEMRSFAKANPDVSATDILRMCTLNAARALKQCGRMGELTPDAKADMIAIPWSGGVSGALDAILDFDGDVMTSMINGRWGIEPQP